MAPNTRPQADQESQFLTVAEVATRLRISDDTVHRWARDGVLPYVPLPSGLKRFRRADIEAIERGEGQLSTTTPEKGPQ